MGWILHRARELQYSILFDHPIFGWVSLHLDGTPRTWMIMSLIHVDSPLQYMASSLSSVTIASVQTSSSVQFCFLQLTSMDHIMAHSTSLAIIHLLYWSHQLWTDILIWMGPLTLDMMSFIYAHGPLQSKASLLPSIQIASIRIASIQADHLQQHLSAISTSTAISTHLTTSVHNHSHS